MKDIMRSLLLCTCLLTGPLFGAMHDDQPQQQSTVQQSSFWGTWAGKAKWIGWALPVAAGYAIAYGGERVCQNPPTQLIPACEKYNCIQKTFVKEVSNHYFCLNHCFNPYQRESLLKNKADCLNLCWLKQNIRTSLIDLPNNDIEQILGSSRITCNVDAAKATEGACTLLNDIFEGLENVEQVNNTTAIVLKDYNCLQDLRIKLQEYSNEAATISSINHLEKIARNSLKENNLASFLISTDAAKLIIAVSPNASGNIYSITIKALELNLLQHWLEQELDAGLSKLKALEEQCFDSPESLERAIQELRNNLHSSFFEADLVKEIIFTHTGDLEKLYKPKAAEFMSIFEVNTYDPRLHLQLTQHLPSEPESCPRYLNETLI